mmetsp:Transcript_55618/g.146750  ORF Transcript_55618/g.146750 Transcript_55618/m.146750 type:complete len:107 (+) Transcript_55618:143-463(+)
MTSTQPSKVAKAEDPNHDRNVGESQWGSYVKPYQPKTSIESQMIQSTFGKGPAFFMPSNSSSLTPYGQIRERLNRGMYELPYDKPCVKVGLEKKDDLFLPFAVSII